MHKNKTPLDEFAKLLENPPHNLLVEVYTENEDEHKPVNKSKEERMTLAKLAKAMDARFDSLESGVKDINARLDYIVKANNLKDLPKN